MNELYENARMNIRKFERLGEIRNIVLEGFHRVYLSTILLFPY
jgi:hypothetical protein